MPTYSGTNGNDFIENIVVFPGGFYIYYETVYGLGGNDTIWGGVLLDTLYGGHPSSDVGSGNDQIFGDNEKDRIYGQDGNDILDGGGGNDTIWGGDGYDSLTGGSGNDSLVGGAGDDWYYVDSTLDVVIENYGEGVDGLSTTITNVTLPAYVENMLLAGTTSAGTGNSLNNLMTANNSANTLNGADGNDLLYGLGNNDTIFGGNGNDTITGGMGQDSMIGGSGADKFMFSFVTDSPIGAGRDVITDFTPGVDKVSVEGIDANLNLSGDQAFATTQISYVPGGIATFTVIGGTGFEILFTGTPALNWTDVIL